jgi:hypothetical protein
MKVVLSLDDTSAKEQIAVKTEQKSQQLDILETQIAEVRHTLTIVLNELRLRMKKNASEDLFLGLWNSKRPENKFHSTLSSWMRCRQEDRRLLDQALAVAVVKQ